MNTSIHLRYTSQCQASNLTNAVQKYIKESIFRISLADFEIMFLRDKFRSEAAGAALAAAILLFSAFGNAATAQDQIARAPAGQPVVTQTVGKPVLLRRGPGFSPTSADDLAAILNERGCPTKVTTERGFPQHLTVDIEGFKPSKFKSNETGDAGVVAERLCLGRT